MRAGSHLRPGKLASIVAISLLTVLIPPSTSAVERTDDSSQSALAPVGFGVYENDSESLSYSGAGWTTPESSSDSGGSHAVSYANGAAVSLQFTGTRVQWISRQTPASGINDVYLDGTKVASIDRYSADAKFQQTLFEKNDLSAGSHTIRVVATGKKNAAATGSSLVLDAFIVSNAGTEAPAPPGVYENENERLSYSGASWTTAKSSSDSGGSHAVSYANGAAVSLQFTGTRVQWISRRTPASGINDIYLDGTKVASIDRYSADAKFQQTLFEKNDLSAGTHTIRVVATGKKNAAATGSSLVLDAFIVSNAGTEPPPTPPGDYENDSESIFYSGAGWTTAKSSSDSGGSHAVSYANGAAVSFTFDVPENGEVAWVSRRTQASGINDVFLDGIQVGTVDRYSATPKFQQIVFRRTGLAQGRHVLRLVNTGKRNPAAEGASLVLDAFIVIERDAPAAPTRPNSWNDGGSLRTSWGASPSSDVVKHNIYKSSSGRTAELIRAVPVGTNDYQDFAVADGVRYSYQITAVDAFGNESAPSALSFSTKRRASDYPYRDATCPAATVVVTSDSDLATAVARISPGDVIQLAPGTYKGRHVIEGVHGSAEEPVWICGPRTAVIADEKIDGGWSIHVENSSYIRLAGFTITHSYGGVMVAHSSNITVADLHLYDIGQEAIHLRSNTTDSTVIGNRIEDTGRVKPQYGEGVYIGSSRANWCTYTECGPDRSDRNAVLNNVISRTTAEPVEAKEGTSSGRIEGNILSGAGILPISEAQGWIAVQGNGWLVRNNKGTDSPADGIRVMEYVRGWGLGNIVSGNEASGISGYGVFTHLPRLGTLVTCLNTASSGVAATNTTCQE